MLVLHRINALRARGRSNGRSPWSTDRQNLVGTVMSDKQSRSRNRTIGIAAAESGSSYRLALLALVVSFFAIGARWLWLYRHGQPFDIDEAGYLMIALGNYHALTDDGFGGWVSSVLGPGLQGPLPTCRVSGPW